MTMNETIPDFCCESDTPDICETCDAAWCDICDAPSAAEKAGGVCLDCWLQSGEAEGVHGDELVTLPETTTIPEKLSAVLAARPWLTGRDVYELLRGPLAEYHAAEEGQS